MDAVTFSKTIFVYAHDCLCVHGPALITNGHNDITVTKQHHNHKRAVVQLWMCAWVEGTAWTKLIHVPWRKQRFQEWNIFGTHFVKILILYCSQTFSVFIVMTLCDLVSNNIFVEQNVLWSLWTFVHWKYFPHNGAQYFTIPSFLAIRWEK